MEQNTTFISSRGLLRSCIASNIKPASSSAEIDADLLSRHRPGGSIYLCTDAVPEFARSWLARVEHDFTLVTGDSDLPVSTQTLGEAVLSALLEHPKCRAWFAQNLQATHARLHPLPIGLDYHTMWEYPGVWGLSRVSPIAQEKQLLETWARSPDTSSRYLVAYVNWAQTIDRGDRRVCLERIERSICLIESARVPRASSWARQAECLFVVSPEGIGMDCHRTWEAILLGCVPIVRRNAISVLFERLPVLIVDDWSEVRRDRLLSYLNELPRKMFDYSSLLRDSWVRRIQGVTEAPTLEMSFAAFRQFLTRVPA